MCILNFGLIFVDIMKGVFEMFFIGFVEIDFFVGVEVYSGICMIYVINKFGCWKKGLGDVIL